MQTNDRNNVAYAATLLRENARSWWNQYLQDHQGKRPKNLQELEAALSARFLSPLFEKQARVQLWTIQQRKGETVHAFSARFQNLLQKLPSYDNEDMLERYIRALHPHLRMPVAQREPQVLSEAIRIAEHLELLTDCYVGNTGDGTPTVSLGQATQRRARWREHRGRQYHGGSQQGIQWQGRVRRCGRGMKPHSYRYDAVGGLHRVQHRFGNQTRGHHGMGRGGSGCSHAQLHAMGVDGWEHPEQQQALNLQAAPYWQGNA